MNTGIGNTCEAGQPITEANECRAAAQAVALVATQFSGFGYCDTCDTVSLNYAPGGCMVYDGEASEFHAFYLNTHAGSATGTPDHHKVRRSRAPEPRTLIPVSRTPPSMRPHQLCKLAEGEMAPSLPPVAPPPPPLEENYYRQDAGVGTWGGSCTCEDGQTCLLSESTYLHLHRLS